MSSFPKSAANSAVSSRKSGGAFWAGDDANSSHRDLGSLGAGTVAFVCTSVIHALPLSAMVKWISRSDVAGKDPNGSKVGGYYEHLR